LFLTITVDVSTLSDYQKSTLALYDDSEGYWTEVEGSSCNVVGDIATCSGLTSHFTIFGIVTFDDEDNDGVPTSYDLNGDGVIGEGEVDKCLGSTIDTAGYEGVRPNHYVVDLVDGILTWENDADFTMVDTYGCTCDDVLICKPGENKGEEKFGCTGATINLFVNQQGWAELGMCFDENGIVEGESKDLLENTDGTGWIDPIDGDNDDDTIPDTEDSLVDDADVEGNSGHGKPDWWERKHPGK